jgi:3-phosphoshikimate 1-carboxyvinyltransferase
VASAQVKSAILLAALYAKGETKLTGKIQSRDHTEKLLPHFGADISVSPESLTLKGGQILRAAKLTVPADPSSAAFWLAAACVVKGGQVRMGGVSLNPTRTGFFRAIERMGAKISERVTSQEPERVGEVELHQAPLRGVSIPEAEVASLIDELPMLAVLAAYAEGVTEVRGAEELRVKETDRIEAIAVNFRAMGGVIETFDDGFRIKGPQKLKGGEVDSLGDHRIAMAFAVGALGAEKPTLIRNAESVNISYPGFFETLQRLSRG